MAPRALSQLNSLSLIHRNSRGQRFGLFPDTPPHTDLQPGPIFSGFGGNNLEHSGYISWGGCSSRQA